MTLLKLFVDFIRSDAAELEVVESVRKVQPETISKYAIERFDSRTIAIG